MHIAFRCTSWINFSAEAMERLKTYSWPGNVRELENCVNYLTCSQLNGPVQATDLPLLPVEQENRSNGPRNHDSTENSDWHVTDANPNLIERPYEAKRDFT